MFAMFRLVCGLHGVRSHVLRCLLSLSEVTFDCGVFTVVACLFKWVFARLFFLCCVLVFVCAWNCRCLCSCGELFKVFVHRPPPQPCHRCLSSAREKLRRETLDGYLAPEILDKKGHGRVVDGGVDDQLG